MVIGNLTITLVEGNLTHDTELFGKMDPYAVFTHGSSNHKSHICDDQGKTPKWIDTHFEFPIKDLSEEIKMEIFDKDLLKSDLVGNTILRVEDLIVKGGVKNWFDIYYKEKSAGKILLSTKWTSFEAQKPVPKIIMTSSIEESKEPIKTIEVHT